MKTKITKLGNGGAFSEVSSAFLIEGRETILFDCGHGIFQKVKDEDIDYIFISHTHLDHISDLERLIYFRYFVRGLKTIVISGSKVIEELKDIFKGKFNSIYVNGQNVPVEMVEFKTMNETELRMTAIGVNHGPFNCYGLYSFFGNFLISGDTKASVNILEVIKKHILIDKIKVYHDFSRGLSHNSIHCCKDDFNSVYFELLENERIEWEFYHTDEEIKVEDVIDTSIYDEK